MPDLRTREGRAHKERIIREATELREMGWQIKEIAAAVGLSPATVSFYLPLHLANLDHLELKDRRFAIRTEQPHEPVTERRRKAQTKRRHVQDYLWLNWTRPLRLDAPASNANNFGHGNHAGLDATCFGDAVPAPSSDPFQILCRGLCNDLLGDLDAADLARMSEGERDRLRVALAEQGFAPSVRPSERVRLREPAPHRGEGISAKVTSMSTAHKHRKPGHKSGAGGSRGARKPRKRFNRDTIRRAA